MSPATKCRSSDKKHVSETTFPKPNKGHLVFSNWVLLVLLGFEPLLLRGGDLRKDTQELGARNCEGVGLLQARDVKVARPKPAEKELQANGRNCLRFGNQNRQMFLIFCRSTPSGGTGTTPRSPARPSGPGPRRASRRTSPRLFGGRGSKVGPCCVRHESVEYSRIRRPSYISVKTRRALEVAGRSNQRQHSCHQLGIGEGGPGPTEPRGWVFRFRGRGFPAGSHG